jgi:hypothetical protein
MSRVSASSAVFPRGFLLGLRLELPAFVIDNNEMKPRSFEQTRKIGDACESRVAFSRRNDLARDVGARRELALT